MIGKLTGQLLENTPPFILLDVQGVGYEVEVTLNVLASLPPTGQPCSLYTHFVVREDAQHLYGFLGRDERELFRLLLKVNGVGPKLAVAMLSHMSVLEFVQCIKADDLVSLTRMPGVGKKTAERLLIEMRDRLKSWTQSAEPGGDDQPSLLSVQSSKTMDAEAALVALGYKPAEANKAIKQLDSEDLSRDELIRRVLKSMLRK